ncbi:hypothetical protein LGQ02_02760 [Bacillus shivajii]|uniref:hypothetical protein n=1 Tax=Bacillus shivajii TaxID=1983719 RepID=UPI001CFB72BF|nr:hypothetical protein [Bacillus shivajii]UCZ53725.1 hypothetical protein LGQ02_02760 [Bacillus shivajii]
MNSIIEPIYKFLYKGFGCNAKETEIGKKEITGKELHVLCQHVVYRRFEFGVEDAYHYLDDPNQKFAPSITSAEYYYYYFLQVLVGVERYEIQRIRQYSLKLCELYEQLKDTHIEKEWNIRQQILNLMVTVLNEEKIEDGKLDDLLKCSEHIPLFSVAIYIHGFLVRSESFETAQLLLEIAKKESRYDKYLSTIYYMNEGFHHYFKNEYELTLTSYLKAQEVLKEAKLDDLERKRLKEEIDLNVRMSEQIVKTQKDAFTLNTNRRKMETVQGELINVDRHLKNSDIEIRNELFQNFLLSKSGFRSSNNLFNADRNYNLSEQYFQIVGSFNGVMSLSTERLKNYINAGYALNDKQLIRISLYDAVIVNNEKAIRSIIEDHFPFENKEQLNDFFIWLFVDREARHFKLGRIYTLNIMMDYVSTEDLHLVLSILLKTIKLNYSFNKFFDYKRPSIRGLGKIFDRLDQKTQESVLDKMFTEYNHGDVLLKNEIIRVLSKIPSWEKISQQYLKIASDKVKEYLKEEKEHSELLINVLVKMNKDAEEEHRKEIADYLEKRWWSNDKSIVIISMYPEFLTLISESSFNSIVNWVIKELDKEIKSRSSGTISYGYYRFGAILASILSTISDKKLLDAALPVLLKYVSVKTKKPEEQYATLNNLGISIITNPSILANYEIKSDIFQRSLTKVDLMEKKGLFTGSMGSQASVFVGTVLVLARIKLTEEELSIVLERIIGILPSLTDEVKAECVKSLGVLWDNNRGNKELLRSTVQQMLMASGDEDTGVKAVSAYWLPQLLPLLTESSVHLQDLVIQTLLKLVKDHNLIVRINLAAGLRDTSSKHEEIAKLKQLIKDDINIRVRKEFTLKKVKK